MDLTEDRSRQRTNPLIPLVIIALSILFALALTEGIVRVFKLWAIPDYLAMDWYRKSPIPGVPYLLKPKLRTTWGIGSIATDDFGLRNNHVAAKPAGVYRILMLGDSVTFGYGVDQTQSFPAELERLLNQSGKYEVINAGVPGYSLAARGKTGHFHAAMQMI